MRIKRFPDGSYAVFFRKDEVDYIKKKLERREELDDEEVVLAREFELI
ncbi:MAG: hypothetical protein J7K36_01245 [Archaeoglobaceae archaeon]|nr:hypothetical protein [Archaeoglobaceae archaeon]